MPAMPDSVKRYLLLVWKSVAVVCAGIIILLALAVGVFRLMLPTVPEYREQIQAAASNFIGRPVTLGNIDARWRFGGPELTFTDTTVYTPDGTEVLAHADLASVGLSLLHYLRTRQLRPGRVTFEGVEVNILRTEDNRLFLSGRQIWPSTGAMGELPVGVFSLRDSMITYSDAALTTGSRVFSQIDVDLELRKTGMQLEGSAELPEGLGEEIEFSARARGDLADFSSVAWQAHVDGEGIDLGGLGSLLREALGSLTAGRGDVQLRGRFRGAKPRALTAMVDIENLALVTGNGNTAAYAGFAGSFQWDGQGAGWQAFARDISVDRNGSRWGADAWRLEYGSTPDSTVMYATADFVRAEDIVPLAALAPDSEWKDRLAQLDPRGDLTRLEASSARSNDVQTRYLLSGSFSNVGWNAMDAVPGVRGIKASLRVDEKGGRLELAPASIELAPEKLFEQSLSANNVQGTVIWRKGTAGWRILSDNLVLDTDAFQSRTSFELQLPEGEESANLDLQAHLTDVSIANATNFLPARIMKPKLTDWLRNALVEGRITQGEVSFAGPLKAFPFDDGGGHFRAEAAFDDLTIAYANGWPAARDARGTVTFANAALAGKVATGRILDTQVDDVSVEIPDLRRSVIAINGNSKGSFGDIIGYLNASPVGEAAGPTLARVEASGDAAADIKLLLPLGRMEERVVEVGLNLSNAEAGLAGIRQRLTEIDGFVQYTNAGIFGDGIVARLLGNTVTLDVAPERRGAAPPEPAAVSRDAATVVTVRGAIGALDLAREFPGSLARVLDGVTDYTARARFPVSRPGRPDFFRVDVDSTLAGMAVGLPAPLEKPGNAQWRMKASAGFPAKDRLELRVERNDADVAQLAFRHDGDGWQLQRGAAAFGGGVVTLPDQPGIVLGGTVPYLDMSGWLNVGDGESGVRAQDILLAADLQAQSLRVFGQKFSNASIVLDRSDREWLLQVEADRLAGALFVPFDTPAGDAITARLDRLWLQSSQDDNRQYPDPRKLPALSLSIEDFQYDQMRFGALEANTRRSADGIVVESMLTRAESFSTQGSGAWTMDASGHRSQVELLFTSTDVLDTLARLDFEPSIDSDSAEVQMALNWPGPPGRNFREQLNGEVTVAVGDGQLQNVQPGAGRVFGLLSITELPRRLSLDFRDVFSSGFGFNAIRGDFTLSDGNAYTSNLVLDGPAAQVGIVGRAGLAARDYDQTAVVHASLGATLPVAGALAGGPAVGAALLIFSEIFKKPLQDMVRVNYRITGSWDDPQVQRVLDSQLSLEGEQPVAAGNAEETQAEPQPQP